MPIHATNISFCGSCSRRWLLRSRSKAEPSGVCSRCSRPLERVPSFVMIATPRHYSIVESQLIVPCPLPEITKSKWQIASSCISLIFQGSRNGSGGMMSLFHSCRHRLSNPHSLAHSLPGMCIVVSINILHSTDRYNPIAMNVNAKPTFSFQIRKSRHA